MTGEVERSICNFYLSVVARKIVSADPSLRYTSPLLGRKATNQQTNKPCRLAVLLHRPWRTTQGGSGPSLQCIYSFLTVNRKSRLKEKKEEIFSKYFVYVNVIENLKGDEHPFVIYNKGRHFSSETFLLTRQLAEDGRLNFLIHGRHLGYIYFVRKVLKAHGPGRYKFYVTLMSNLAARRTE